MQRSYQCTRRTCISTLITSCVGVASIGFSKNVTASAAKRVRMQWPWPVHAPNPYALHDLVAALIGSSLYPSLYVGTFDDGFEPMLAIGPPVEDKVGLRIDLSTKTRPIDVVYSIQKAKQQGCYLWLQEVPVPRVDTASSVVFHGLTDREWLMKKLASPLVGMQPAEQNQNRKISSFELKVTEHQLVLQRRSDMAASKIYPMNSFELMHVKNVSDCLQSFERSDVDIGWLSPPELSPRPGARNMDYGSLAYVALITGNEASELAQPNSAIALVDAIANDRLMHLGLLKRGLLSSTPQLLRILNTKLATRAPILLRRSTAYLQNVADVLAHLFGGTPQLLEDIAFERDLLGRHFALALDVVRPFEPTELGAIYALSSMLRGNKKIPSNTTLRSYCEQNYIALGWELSLIGAQASNIWVPRLPYGGLDLENAAVY